MTELDRFITRGERFTRDDPDAAYEARRDREIEASDWEPDWDEVARIKRIQCVPCDACGSIKGGICVNIKPCESRVAKAEALDLG